MVLILREGHMESVQLFGANQAVTATVNKLSIRDAVGKVMEDDCESTVTVNDI